MQCQALPLDVKHNKHWVIQVGGKDILITQ